LKKLADRFALLPKHAIGGHTVNFLPENPYSAASQTGRDGVYAYNTTRDKILFFPSSNLAMPADEFRRVGAFDPTFRTSEDRDLYDRWRCYGLGMTFAPEVLAYHNHPLTFRTFWRRYFNIGRGAFRFRRAASKRGSSSFKVDGRFYLHAFRYPFPREPGWRALRVTTLLATSQVANALGFFWEWLREPEERG